MSFLDGALGAAGELLDDAYALIAPGIRMIGAVIPDCTIEEHHKDIHAYSPLEGAIARRLSEPRQ